MSSIITIVLLYAVYRYFWSTNSNYDKCWERQGIPVARVSWLTKFTKQWHHWERDLYQKYGLVFGIYELGKPILYLSDPDLIRDVLVKDFNVFNNRRDTTTGVDPIVDNMMDLLRDERWKTVRSIVTPTFSTGKLRKMLPSIINCLRNLDKNMSKKISSENTNTNNNNNKLNTDLKKLFGAYTMELLIQVAFGVNVDGLDETNPIILNILEMLDYSPSAIVIQSAPKLARLLRLTFFNGRNIRFFRDMTVRIIAERRRRQQQLLATTTTTDAEDTKPVDFLQIMLDSLLEANGDQTNGKYMTNDEFLAQCVLFLLAGYETTTSTISMVIYNIANSPRVQQKCYEEAKQYYNENKVIDYEVMQNLKYLDAVISESMRLYPVLPFFERQANRDYQLGTGGGSNGILVPKDTIVHIPVWSIQRDHHNYPDPDKFLPERFLGDTKHLDHHPYAYLPFGSGPRSCPGMRYAQLVVKLAILQSVYNYKFHPTTTPVQVDCVSMVLVPKEVKVLFEKLQFIPKNYFL
ncbi:cytochrome P450 3A56-like [Oppia nitens]|uniref:cytochrome P450 3A56-like n=1 Tax=Oppia nitens TaxID=1686743 RepID=UPI0023DC2ADD|nr:cytochrome P450 3A56-like [Oppia nitens]